MELIVKGTTTVAREWVLQADAIPGCCVLSQSTSFTWVLSVMRVWSKDLALLHFNCRTDRGRHLPYGIIVGIYPSHAGIYNINSTNPGYASNFLHPW